MKVVQRWQCGVCGQTYDAPIPVSEVLCPKKHTSTGRGRSGHMPMELIQGSTVPNRRKKASSGKS